ncbi:hypothetical protein SERLA73DRAFT_74462 [Serpula lacrymans var. lacrymans S7.3]|uniref:Ras GEF n=2 Tax=Serpula lacrymans var. lacrymans TaxID=341189 RepID=F8Q1Q5_SERL3|nr:uncharacterized protein SERLADRAFT_409070 [Serpula lacrymans var. lacrymans S7.9]EGN98233.1 hypothetical protein SERLA73DRAFT_74462 [Serpula lacrymans var. lacrymans S7.3]EGO23807.1 hypothetical protein SERLADRAFT_409070 [Serpula lacrymans var. lacrymans S7.9]
MAHSTASVTVGKPRPLTRKKTMPSLHSSDSRSVQLKSSSQELDAVSLKTASIMTHDQSPSSPRVFSPTQPTINLECTFPAIIAPITILRRVPLTQNLDAVRSLAPIITNCLSTILDSMAQLPEGVRASSSYQLAKSDLLFSKDMFLSHAETIDPNLVGRERNGAIQTSLRLLEVMMSGLKGLLRAAERELIDSKPLPPTPECDTDDAVLVDIEEGKVLNVFSPAAVANATHPSQGVDPNFHATPREKRERVVRRKKSKINAMLKPLSVLVKCGKQSTERLASSTNDSSSTLVRTDSDSDTKKSQDASSTLNTISDNVVDCIRNSIAQFPDDFFLDGDDATLPPHPDDASELCFNATGDILGGASLKALVRILTSKDGLPDCNFTDFFLLSFRYFTTPEEALAALIDRYHEKTPENLTPLQLPTWEREAYQIKLRVAKVLYLWTDKHWRPEEDEPAFNALLQFAFCRLTPDLPRPVSKRVIDTLHRYACDKSNFRGRRLECTTAIGESHLPTKPIPATGWLPSKRKAMEAGDFSEVDILSFDCTSGHEELARQLSLALSELYLDFRPEDAVKFWKDGLDQDVGRKITAIVVYERALSNWTTSVILSSPIARSRAAVIGCLLQISTKCMAIRNFGASAAIYTGIMRVLDRLKATRSEIFEDHNKLLRVVGDVIPLDMQRKSYWNALGDEILPTVPIMSIFIGEIQIAFSHPSTREYPKGSGCQLINVHRYRNVVKVIQAMEKSHVPYKLQRVNSIQKWLNAELGPFIRADLAEENRMVDAFYAKTREIEPKGAKPPHRSWQRMLDIWVHEFLPRK